jgi:uncharacterized protein YdhG (YjbR/CyaY superfamily)
MAKKPKSVEEYINMQTEPIRTTLGRVRKAVNSSAPEAEENIGYGIPYYKYKGAFIAFMSHANHCSFVTMSYDIVKELKDELKNYKVSGTTIRFPHDKPLPAALVKKIVVARIKEQDGKKEFRAKIKNAGPADAVNEYMARLKHPLKNEIEAVRKIIKGANRKINERIKWNAPSYCTTEDFVTFNPRNLDAVHLVFHHPLIIKIKSSLLEGDYKDRRMVYLKNMKDIKAHKEELTKIINKLVQLINKK